MSGGSDSASKQAQANENARQAAVASGTASVNKIFDDPSRTAAYDKLSADTTAYYTQQLDQQKQLNDRQLKFAQARNGQTGGSVQTDQDTQAGKDYLQGVLSAQRMGAQAGADLQSKDTSERASLIAAVQGGLDATSAASNAAAAMKGNLDSAQSTATANAFGQTFGDFSSIYQKSQDAKALRQGQLYSYNTVYQPGFGAGAAGGGGSHY
jgi:hypothetical protein